MSTLTSPSEIERLNRFSQARLGQFGLAVVQVNTPRRRDELLSQFTARMVEEGIEVRRIEYSHVNALLSLRDDLRTRLAAEPVAPASKMVLALVGLDHLIVPPDERADESSKALPFVVGLNLERDGFRTDVPYPLLLWLSETAVDTLFRHAPDFADWITSLIRVTTPTTKPVGPPDLPLGASRESSNLLSYRPDAKPTSNLEQRLEALNARATELHEEGEPAEPRLAQVLQELGELYAETENYGQLELAVAPLTNAIALYEKLGDKLACAESQLALANVEYLRDQDAKAEFLAKSALTTFVELGDEVQQAKALRRIGDACTTQDKYFEAVAALHQSRHLFSKHKNTVDEAYTVLSLGMNYRKLGEFEAAREHFNQARKLFRAGHAILGEANVFNSLADLYRQTNRMDDAARCLRSALDLFRKTGNMSGQAHASETIGDMALQQGHYSKAQQAYQDALRIYRELDRPGDVANATASISQANYSLGERTLSNTQLTQALAFIQSAHNRYGEASVYWWRGEVCLRLGEYADAREALHKCLDICTELNLDNWIVDCREKLAALNEQELAPAPAPAARSAPPPIGPPPLRPARR